MSLQRKRLPSASCAFQSVTSPALQAEFLDFVRKYREPTYYLSFVTSGAHDTGKLCVLGEAKPNLVTDHFKDHVWSVNLHQMVTVDIEMYRYPVSFVDWVFCSIDPATPVIFVVVSTHAIPIYQLVISY